MVLLNDETKLVELLENCDEEAFAIKEDVEDVENNEVVVASPSAAMTLIMHVVLQIIIALGLKSWMAFSGINSFLLHVSFAGSNLGCHISKERQ